MTAISAAIALRTLYRRIKETLHLASISGLSRSIRRGLAEPVEQCTKTIDL